MRAGTVLKILRSFGSKPTPILLTAVLYIQMATAQCPGSFPDKGALLLLVSLSAQCKAGNMVPVFAAMHVIFPAVSGLFAAVHSLFAAVCDFSAAEHSLIAAVVRCVQEGCTGLAAQPQAPQLRLERQGLLMLMVRRCVLACACADLLPHEG